MAIELAVPEEPCPASEDGEHDWQITESGRSVTYIKIRKWRVLACANCDASKEEEVK